MKKIYSPSIYMILLPIYSFLITFYSIFWDPKKGSVIDFSSGVPLIILIFSLLSIILGIISAVIYKFINIKGFDKRKLIILSQIFLPINGFMMLVHYSNFIFDESIEFLFYYYFSFIGYFSYSWLTIIGILQLCSDINYYYSSRDNISIRKRLNKIVSFFYSIAIGLTIFKAFMKPVENGDVMVDAVFYPLDVVFYPDYYNVIFIILITCIGLYIGYFNVFKVRLGININDEENLKRIELNSAK